MRSLLVLLFALASACGSQTFLVCAGVEKYHDERIAPLQFAVADAKATAAAFRAAGVAHRTLTLLTSDAADPERQPTRINLLTALEHVKERATREDKVVVFFAGHGVEQDGQQYLLSADTRLSLLAATALPMALVNEALRGLQAQEVLFLIDACRNDPNRGRATADAQLTESLARGLRPQLAAEQDAPRPRVVATLLACEVGQRAWEDPEAQHGVFTEYLLQGLAGQAAEAGAVKLSSLAGYVSRQLRDWSARTGKPQAPKLVNPEGGDMVVLVPPAEPVVSVAFANRTLAEVIGELGEQYGAQITLGRGADPEAKVTGRLEAVPLGTALKALLAAYDLRVRRSGSIYIIEAKDAPVEAGRPTLVVAPDGTGDCRSIGEAVKRAQPGTLVQVEPGVYRETVILDKDLELKGDGEPGKVVVEVTGGYCLSVVRGTCKVAGLSFRHLAPTAPAPETDWDAEFVRHDPVHVRGGASLTIEDGQITSNWATHGLVAFEGASCVARRLKVTVSRQGTWGPAPDRADAIAADHGQVVAEDCTVESGNQGVVASNGGSLILRRCSARAPSAAVEGYNRARGRADDFGGASLSLEDCALNATSGVAVVVREGARCTLSRCRVSAAQTGMNVDQAVATAAACDWTECRQGAYAVEPEGILLAKGNTVRPGDPTAKLAFSAPVLTVAPQGGDYPTIGAAVKAAQPGTLVLVRPGRYREGVTIDKSLELRGDGPRDQVIIEADAQAVLRLRNAPSLVLSNLTVRQTGAATGQRVDDVLGVDGVAELTVLDCDVQGLPERCLHGVFVNGGRARFVGCQLSGSTALSCYSACRAVLERCRLRSLATFCALESQGRSAVRASRCELSGGEHGVFCGWGGFGRATAELDECTISDCRAGATAANGGSISLARCPIRGNGVGVVANTAGRAIVRDSDLRGNRAGAYRVDGSARLEQSGNTYDPADKTVPATAVVSPTIIVTPDGSGSFKTITDALTHAAPGSTIHIRPGVYRESLVLPYPVTLVGDGGREKVIIEAVGQSVAIVNGREVGLQGLTLRLSAPERNPERDWRDTFPLVIDDGGQLAASDCRFTTNWAVWCDVIANGGPSGGGSASFSNCVADGAANGFGAAGGQVALDGCAARYVDAHAGGTLKARRCQFGGASSWGKPTEAPGRVELEECTVTGSQTAGFLARAGASAKLVRCTLQQNAGAGLSVAGLGSRVELDHCTVTGNAKGAFELKDGGQISHTGCIFDASDTTVAAAGKP